MRHPFTTALFRASGLLFALATAASAQADELPLPKAGLWEMKMSMQMSGVRGVSPGVREPTVTRKCVDQSSEKEARDMLMGGSNSGMTCSKRDIRKTATGYAVDSVCTSKLVGTTTTTHTEITGDFSSGYTLKGNSHSQSGVPNRPGHEMNMTGQAKWLGACPAGWKPGDVEMDGGKRFNVNDLK
jgi:hypothetical protein